jgi:hypothetical protein
MSRTCIRGSRADHRSYPTNIPRDFHLQLPNDPRRSPNRSARKLFFDKLALLGRFVQELLDFSRVIARIGTSTTNRCGYWHVYSGHRVSGEASLDTELWRQIHIYIHEYIYPKHSSEFPSILPPSIVPHNTPIHETLKSQQCPPLMS